MDHWASNHLSHSCTNRLSGAFVPLLCAAALIASTPVTASDADVACGDRVEYKMLAGRGNDGLRVTGSSEAQALRKLERRLNHFGAQGWSITSEVVLVVQPHPANSELHLASLVGPVLFSRTGLADCTSDAADEDSDAS